MKVHQHAGRRDDLTRVDMLSSIRRRLEERVPANSAPPAEINERRLVDCEQVRAKLPYILAIGPPEEAVREAYQALFNREPDPAGFDYYVGRLRLGFSKLEMLVEFTESQEGRRAGAHVLAPELKLLRSTVTDWGVVEPYEGADFIRILYRVILNIDPDSRSVVLWVSFLDRGLLSKREIFESFLQTKEAVAFRQLP